MIDIAQHKAYACRCCHLEVEALYGLGKFYGNSDYPQFISI